MAKRKQTRPRNTQNIDLRQDQPPQQVLARSVSLTSQEGPLPDSAEFQRYDQVLPGAADRILTMAESNNTHSQGMERLAIEKASGDVRSRLRYSFVLFLSCVCLSAYALHLGHVGTASAFIGVPLVVVVGFFLDRQLPKGLFGALKKN